MRALLVIVAACLTSVMLSSCWAFETNFGAAGQPVGAGAMAGAFGTVGPDLARIENGKLVLSAGPPGKATETYLYNQLPDPAGDWTLESRVAFSSETKGQQAGVFFGTQDANVRVVVGKLLSSGSPLHVGLYGPNGREEIDELPGVDQGASVSLRLVQLNGMVWGFWSADGRTFHTLGALPNPGAADSVAGLCFVDLPEGGRGAAPGGENGAATFDGFTGDSKVDAGQWAAIPRTFMRVKLLDAKPGDKPVKLAGTFYGKTNERMYRFGLTKAGEVHQFDTSWGGHVPWKAIADEEGLRSGEQTGWCEITPMLQSPEPQMTLALAFWEDGLKPLESAGNDGGNVQGFDVEIDLATAPSDGAIVSTIKSGPRAYHTLGIYFPSTAGEPATWAGHAMTMFDYARARWAAYLKAGVTQFPAPRLFPITGDLQDGYHVDLYDANTDAAEEQIRGLLGINRVEIQTGDPTKAFKVDPWAPDLQQQFVDVVNKRYATVPDGRYYVKVGDEINMLKVATLRNSPTGLAAFRQWLQQRGVKPSDLGANSLDDVVPLERTKLRNVCDARTYYYAIWFLQESTAQTCRAFSDAFHQVRGEGAITGTDVYYGGFDLTLDYFVESRAGTFQQQMHHFGSGEAGGGTRQIGDDLFLADTLRSAAQFGKEKPGILWFPGRIAQEEGTLLSGLTALAHGMQRIHFYGYGPMFAGWEYFSDDRYKVDTFRGASTIGHMAAQYENYLLDGRRPKADVAVLLSRGGDIWGDLKPKDFQDVFGYPTPKSAADKQALALSGATGGQGWGCERRMLEAALQWANCPADIVPEEEIEGGRLNDYKVLYVYEPNLTAKAQAAVAQWVRAGGTLYLGPSAAARDEFNSPCSLLTTLAGRADAAGLSADQIARDRDAWSGAKRYTESATGELEALDTVRVGAGPSDAPFDFAAVGRKEVINVPGATVLARYGDGSAAVVSFSAGSGTVVKCGVPLGAAYARTAQPAFGAVRPGVDVPPLTSPSAGTPAYWRRTLDTHIQDLILYPVRKAANLTPPVQCSVRGVDSGLYELPDNKGALLLLGTYTTQDTSALRVQVRLGAHYNQAHTFSGQPVQVSWAGNTATITLKLGVVEGVELTP